MAVKLQDYYETPGIKRTATTRDIKQAFRKLARLHQPDVAKDKVVGEAKFKEINEAYKVLGDAEKRKGYDELGANWQGDVSGAPAPASRRGRGGGPDVEFDGTGFSDFFESFFAGGRDGFGSRHARDGRGFEDDTPFTHPGRTSKPICSSRWKRPCAAP